MAALDYSFVQRIIDGTGRILDTTMSNPNTGSYITEAQLRDWIKGQTVQEGYYYNGNFYSNSGHTSLMAKVNGSLYVDKGSNALYYCLSSAYVALTEEAAVQAIRTELLNGTLEPLVSTKAKQDANGAVIDTTYAKIAELLDGTVVPLKAKQDQNGNVIDTTYATKAELATEQNARESADSDLQSQLVNINSEVDNIEALIGDEAQVENVDPSTGSLLAQSRLIHHANLLPNGSFGRVGARSVAWNQLVNMPSAPHGISNLTITYYPSEHYYTISGGQPSASDQVNIQPQETIIVGHKYLIRDFFAQRYASRGTWISNLNGTADWSPSIIDTTNWNTGDRIRISVRVETTQTYSVSKKYYPMLTDLTIMSMATGYTVDQLASIFCGSYGYDTGHIYDLNPSGFRIRGINLWDEEWELGVISSTTGEDSSSNSNIRSKNYFEVSPSKTYYLMSSNIVYIRQYDENKDFIATGNTTAKNSSFTTEPNCHFLKFFVISDYGTTYNHNIQICLDSLPTSIKTTYHSYDGHTVDTPQISDGHYVNENIYDYVENVVEDGIVKGKKHTVVGSVDLGSLSWTRNTTSGISYFISEAISNMAYYTLARTIPFLCAKYLNIRDGRAFTDIPDKCCYGGGGQSYIYVRDDSYSDASVFKSAMDGVYLYYDLATETVTDVEPLRSFPISDYSTVEPITPQDELVNRIDVPFSVKSVSANTLIEQINQNTADIAEEKAIRSAQVSALDKRVTNLELKTGDQFDVDYPSDTYGMDGVPSNVEPYAEVKVLKGVGRGVNQLVDNSTFDVKGNWTDFLHASTVTVSNNVLTAVENNSNDRVGFGRYLRTTANHSYLCLIRIDSATSGLALEGGIRNFLKTVSVGFNALVITTNADSIEVGVASTVGISGATVSCSLFNLKDLNVYFNTTDLSSLGETDSAKLATIQQKYPWLLEPSDYGTSAVFSTHTAVKSVGRNLAKTNPTFFDSPYIPTFDADKCYKVTAGVTYYWKIFEKTFTTYRARLFFYDMEGNPLTTPSTSWVTEVSSNGFYVNGQGLLWGGNASDTTKKWTFSQNFYILFVFTLGDTTSSSVISKFCFNVTDADDGTFTEYFTDTLTLPTPVTLKEAGSVSEEYYPKTGRITHPVDSATVTIESIYQRESNPNCDYALFRIPSAWLNVISIFIEGVLRAVGLSWDTVATPSLFLVYDTANRWMAVSVSKGTTLEQAKATYDGRAICYALATPSPDTYVDPIFDPHVKVEPNGTVKPVQSQPPEIDSAMTVEYMAS